MSTLAYAAHTTNRQRAAPGTSMSRAPPGVGTYVDALAALVPAETLTLHATILTLTTRTDDATTTITERGTLIASFFGLIALSVALYVVPRLVAGRWDRLDYLRALIPPLAFVGWTMLQRATAFDAVWPGMNMAARTVIALFLGVLLGLLAASLAYEANQKQP